MCAASFSRAQSLSRVPRRDGHEQAPSEHIITDLPAACSRWASAGVRPNRGAGTATPARLRRLGRGAGSAGERAMQAAQRPVHEAEDAGGEAAACGGPAGVLGSTQGGARVAPGGWHGSAGIDGSDGAEVSRDDGALRQCRSDRRRYWRPALRAAGLAHSRPVRPRPANARPQPVRDRPKAVHPRVTGAVCSATIHATESRPPGAVLAHQPYY